MIINLSSQIKSDFLMGSVVKSDIWEIDRIKNKEFFKGNVLFENNEYIFKSNSAIYDHNGKEWDIFGNVYCRKKIDFKKYVELNSEKAKYSQETQIANISSNNGKRLIIRYIEYPDILYTAFSKKAEINTSRKEMIFIDDFELNISSISGFSGKSIYRESTGIFEMEQKPQIKTYNDKYNVYLEAERIILNIIEKNVTAVSHVYGTVYRRRYETDSKKSN